MIILAVIGLRFHYASYTVISNYNNARKKIIDTSTNDLCKVYTITCLLQISKLKSYIKELCYA